MAFKDRENSILEYLGKNREATVDELCAKFFVSVATIRRDLKALAEKGKIIRTHGGAFLSGFPGESIPQELREREFVEEKDIIAKKCLDLIHDGDSVMIDASSTCLQLIKLLSAKKAIVLITNSTKASFISAKTGVKTIVTGGEVSKTSFSYIGSIAEETIRKFNADICFFSVCSLSPDGLLTNNSTSENQLCRVMLEKSKKSVLLLNSQKIGEPKLNTLCTLNDVDFVVSEKNISDKFPGYEEKFI
ncbi:MAG: DeoR/GlpR transcriptional regulator [Ruminococcaceae bacterium]|nr:DeoR/GlpR transcriptional regulator [Oscillospiraceae bacterium]